MELDSPNCISDRLENADQFVDEFYPSGARMSAIYKRGHAYITLGFRKPLILTKIMDQLYNDKKMIEKELGTAALDQIETILEHIRQLRDELETNKPIRLLPATKGAPDALHTVWNNYLQQMACSMNCLVDEVRWYNAPWIFSECYLYKRVHDAFNSTSTTATPSGQSHFASFDYFKTPKQDAYKESVKEITNLGEFMVSADLGSNSVQQILLHLSLWSNRADLCMSAGGTTTFSSDNLMRQLKSLEEESLLCDDSGLFWDKLGSVSPTQEESSVGYVLDNAGLELFTDLCFADALLNRVNHVTFYVKPIPWFISDTMAHDITWLLAKMAGTENEALKKLATKWKSNFETQRFRVFVAEFWSYPHLYNEMPTTDPELYARLQSHTAMIFKGDLNYRKLVQDRNWKKSTPFAEALDTFRPAPLLALRTIKADMVAGIDQLKADWLDQNKSGWMVTGEYGVIQFADAHAQ